MSTSFVSTYGKRFINFPLFNPLTGEQASEGYLYEDEFYGRPYVGCHLMFSDGKESIRLLVPAERVKTSGHSQGDRTGSLRFGWAVQRSWLVYSGRPYPFHRNWIGATVAVELGMTTEDANHFPVGTGCKGVIEDVDVSDPLCPRYVVRYADPQPSPMTAINDGLNYRGRFYPFQLALYGPLETPDQDFYTWMAEVIEGALLTPGDELEKKIVANWLDGDGQTIMYDLYNFYHSDPVDGKNAILYANGNTPEAVGSQIWLIESANETDTDYIQELKAELGF